MSEHRYRAFLCYSHRDTAWAEWLHDSLESYPVPPRLVGLSTATGVVPPRLAPIFKDREELPSAASLDAKVTDALAQSAAMIVICSPHAAQSRWVNAEITAFRKLGRGQRILCLVVDGEPGARAWSGREHDECMPAALMREIDGDTPPEPIAADARAGKDGRSDARLKLIAGLLGLGLDDLRHRERRRRRRKLLVAVVGGLILLCVTTTLAINAVIARRAAERRQEQAEALVGFMLGDLDDKLREVNRLDILESVAERVVHYFAAMPPADVTDDTLAQRTRAELKLGSAQRDQGRAEQALQTFTGALAASNELLRRDAANPDYEAVNAEALSWVGMTAWSEGKLDDALARFNAALAQLLRASAQRPEDSELGDRVAAARTNTARVYEARGQYDEARDQYIKVLDTYSYLARREPDKLEWRTELGYAHNNLAQLSMKNGRLFDAVKEYAADREIKLTLHQLDSGNNARREDLVASEAFLGRALYATGDIDGALDHLKSAMDSAETLLLVDPNSSDWLEKAGSYGCMLGKTYRVLGKFAEAERADTAAVARLQHLVTRDASNVVWQRSLAGAEAEDARRLIEAGDARHARDRADAALVAIEGVLKVGADDWTTSIAAAQVSLVAGDAASSLDESERARALWHRGRDALEERVGQTKDPFVLDVWLQLGSRLGVPSAAGDKRRMLLDIGYRDPDFVRSLSPLESTIE